MVAGGRAFRAVVGAAAVVLVVACGSSDPAPMASTAGSVSTEAPSGQAQPDVAGQVDIGDGRSIYLECRGTGSPTVVLVTGLAERADNWMVTGEDVAPTQEPVFPAIARSTRVCAYDRPGTETRTEAGIELSRSTPIPAPATIADSAGDLDALLTASGESGPYVFVGHSVGGPIVRLHAGAHPDQVAGLVFVDSLSEDLGDGLTPAQLAAFEELNSPESQGRAPESERDLYTSAVVPLLRAAPPAPVVPTIILTADRWPLTPEVIASGALPASFTQELSDALWASQLAAQDRFAAMFPHARHITETDSGHYIHVDNPQLVIDSIGDVVEQVRAEPSQLGR